MAYSDGGSRSGGGYSGGRAVSYGKSGKAKKKGGKGVGGFLGNVGSDLKDIAVGSAVGAAKITQAVASDAAHGKGIAGVLAMAGPQAIITLPARKAAYGDVWEGGRSELDKIVEPIVKGSAESIKKTATDPGYWYDHPVDAASNLLLFTGGIAGGVSRAGNAAKAAKAGEGVAKALLSPAREARFVKAIDPVTGATKAKVVRGSYSKSAQARAVQKGVDKFRESGVKKGSARATSRNADQFGKAMARNQRIAFDLETVPAAQLQAMDARAFFGKRRISDQQLLAVRAVANKSHPDLYISFLKNEAAKLTKPAQRGQLREIRKNIALWEQAKRYVDRLPDDPTVPVLSDKRLQDFAAKTFEVSNKRTQDLIERGLLDPSRADFRAGAEARLLRGAEFYTSQDFRTEMSAARSAAREIARGAKSARKDALKEFYRQIDNATSREGKAFRFSTTRGPEERAALGVEKDLARSLGEDLTQEDFGALAAARKMVEDAERARDAAAAGLNSSSRVARVNAEDAWKQADEVIRQGAAQAEEILRKAEENKSQIGRLIGAEDFAAANPDLVRIPFKWSTRDVVARKIKGVGAGGTVGIQNRMSTLGNSFQGGILKAGGGSTRVGQIVAKDAVEAVRWWTSEDFRQTLRQIGSEDPFVFPEGTPLVAVRTERRQLPPKEASAVKDFIVRHEEKPYLTKQEQQTFAALEKAEFEHVFPKGLAPAPTEGIVWVPRKMLGGLDRATPSAIENVAMRRTLDAFDSINNAQKFAILYAKLGYIVPNLVGNAALLLIQQGPFAVRSLTRASRLDKQVRPQMLAAVDTLMGEGLFHSTFAGANPKKLSAAAVNVGSKAYGRLTDTPFRRASFFHEAGVRGFKTQKQLEDLLTNPAHRDKLYEITIEANNDLIDYGRLGPVEKAWVRRIVFFYPWVKGATRYAGRFVKEHPIQAGVMNQIGNFGTQYQEQVLGPLASFHQGLTPVTDEITPNPRVMNVSGITPFATPFQTGQSLLSPFTKADGDLAASLTPAAGAALTMFSGKNRLGFDPRGKGNFRTALEDQYQNIPLKLFVERMLSDEPTSGSLIQRSQRDALLQFLLGGAAPATLNKAKENQYAREGR